MLRCLDNTVGLARFAGPGAWNDPDMLEASALNPDIREMPRPKPLRPLCEVEHPEPWGL